MYKKITIWRRKRLNGFTLLEVLIALLVLSIGLLGLAALQAHTLKVNHGALQRTQATFLAYDIIDRLRANRAAALAGKCDIGLGQVLSGGTMCDTDVTDWQNNFVAAYLPSGQGSINCTAAGSLCSVVVQWDESRQKGSPTMSFSIVSEI